MTNPTPAADYLAEARAALERGRHPAELEAARYALAEAMALQALGDRGPGMMAP